MEVQVMTNVLAKNDAIAETLQQQFKEKRILVMNLLGSPGAGKRSLLEATLQTLSIYRQRCGAHSCHRGASDSNQHRRRLPFRCEYDSRGHW